MPFFMVDWNINLFSNRRVVLMSSYGGFFDFSCDLHVIFVIYNDDNYS